VVGTFTRRSASKKPMRRFSLLVGILLAALAAGCSLGGGSGGAASQGRTSPLAPPGNLTPTALAEVRVSRIPLLFTDGRPLASVKCNATGYTGSAACSGYLPGSGAGQRVMVFLRLTGANKPVPTCTLGHGPSPDQTLFCVS
jgi:hypothetical protein